MHSPAVTCARCTCGVSSPTAGIFFFFFHGWHGNEGFHFTQGRGPRIGSMRKAVHRLQQRAGEGAGGKQ